MFCCGGVTGQGKKQAREEKNKRKIDIPQLALTEQKD